MQPTKEDSWFERRSLTPPSRTSHGVSLDDISDKLRQLKPHSWRMEGNKLIGYTEMGEVVNFIPTNKLLTGTDDKGLPIFRTV